MLLATLLAATLSVERAPINSADAVVAVPKARVILLQRESVVWMYTPATGSEKRVASDSMFLDAKIDRAFVGANRIYVTAGTALYDIDRGKRLVIGRPLRGVHVYGGVAILETENGPPILLRFDDNDWKPLYGGGVVNGRVVPEAAGNPWLDVARKLTAGLPKPTVEELRTFEETHQRPDGPRVHASFDGRSAILELPVSMAQGELDERGRGVASYRVKWHTLLVLSNGSHYELPMRLPDNATIHLDDAGNFLIVHEGGAIEEVKVKLP